MMKIMFLCHGAGNGGAERVITTLANEFSCKDFQVSMVTTNEDKNDYLMREEVHRERILSKKNTPIGRTFDRVLKLRKLVETEKYDCVISFSAVPNMQFLAATIGLKCGKIISERTDPNRYPKSIIGKLLRNILYPMADCVVFQTNDAKEYFENRHLKHSVVISNPISNNLPDLYEGQREERIIGVGSLGEQKNWKVALSACEKFFACYPKYRLDIYGEGPERDELQNIIDNSSILRKRVKLMGFSDNIFNEVRTAKMYISSSKYEGISNAMLEALALGTPTICTDCPVGGARQFIQPMENGLLVPVGDADALANAMIMLASNDELCLRFTHNSPVVRSTLSIEKIVKLWEEEIKSVCK